MITSRAVRKDDLLFAYINEMYVVGVDDQGSAEAKEDRAFISKLFSYHVFYLSKLVGYKSGAVVQSDNIRIIAV